jgi:ABC-2 type transport system permease protein
VTTQPFPYLLLPLYWAARNRARRREKGDAARALVFGLIGLGVAASIFAVSFYLSWLLLDYQELGDYLVRLGLGWLFLTFLSFVAFSALVSALSTFFLSEDLRLVLAAPVDSTRLFYSRYARTVVQAGWMVVAFVLPVLLGLGLARCAGWVYYLTLPVAVVPFVLIPAALGCILTLVLVNTFPARRARDVLMLMGVLFAIGLVVLLRFLRPERLLDVRALPDVTAFFATLRSPVTPLLPSFWTGEALFTALQGGVDALHLGALWTTGLALTVFARMAYGRFYFTGWSKAQEARKARFTKLARFELAARRLPLPASARGLLVKDVKVFLRDTTQWSQLLLLAALAFVYVYNFKVLDLSRIPYMSFVVKNVYAFVNLGMAAFVLSAVAVRFVFPSVSAEGQAFWIVRTAPVSMRSFLWSKFWTSLVPIVFMAVALTVTSNHLLGVDPLLKALTTVTVVFMAFGLVGLAAGMGAQHPRFSAENLTQVAGSYGGIAFMVLAVLFILVIVGLLAWPASYYLWALNQGLPLGRGRQLLMAACLLAAASTSILTGLVAMRRGVRALEDLG